MPSPGSYQIEEEDTVKSFDDLASKIGIERQQLAALNSNMDIVPPKGTMILTSGPQFQGQFMGPQPQFSTPKKPTAFMSGKYSTQAGYTRGPITLNKQPSPTYSKPKTSQSLRMAGTQAQQALGSEEARLRQNVMQQLNLNVEQARVSNDRFEENYQRTGEQDFSLLPPLIQGEVAARNGWTAAMMASRGFTWDEAQQGYVNPGGVRGADGSWIKAPTTYTGRPYNGRYGTTGPYYRINANQDPNNDYAMRQIWKKKANGKYRLEMGNWGGQDDRREANRAEHRRVHKPTWNGAPTSVLNLKMGSG